MNLLDRGSPTFPPLFPALSMTSSGIASFSKQLSGMSPLFSFFPPLLSHGSGTFDQFPLHDDRNSVSIGFKPRVIVEAMR